jgi:hypothetical protein
MRLFHALLLLPLFGAPALAESVAPPTAEHHGRRSAADHFSDANTTHDGRLTLDQASAGYKSIAKAFTQIDASHHGYVTLDDIKAWKAAKKAARQAAKHAAAEPSDASDAIAGILRPVPATQRWMGPRATDTATDMVVPASATRPRIGVDLPTAPLDGPRSS